MSWVAGLGCEQPPVEEAERKGPAQSEALDRKQDVQPSLCSSRPPACTSVCVQTCFALPARERPSFCTACVLIDCSQAFGARFFLFAFIFSWVFFDLGLPLAEKPRRLAQGATKMRRRWRRVGRGRTGLCSYCCGMHGSAGHLISTCSAATCRCAPREPSAPANTSHLPTYAACRHATKLCASFTLLHIHVTELSVVYNQSNSRSMYCSREGWNVKPSASSVQLLCHPRSTSSGEERLYRASLSI